MGKCVAIITARGGSKRIPKKNIKPFLGQSIIKYSIDAALQSDCFDEVMVSTDDTEIREIAEQFGAKVPFMRSKATSDDYATTAEVVEEVLLEYKKRGRCFDYCCCIYPAAPFISPDKLQKGFRILKNKNADTVLPVVKFGYPIQRALKIVNERLSMFWPENIDTRSQDLTPAYHDVGQFYWLRVDVFLEQKKLLTENTVPMELTCLEVQDIDTAEDWKIAEIKYTMSKDCL